MGKKHQLFLRLLYRLALLEFEFESDLISTCMSSVWAFFYCCIVGLVCGLDVTREFFSEGQDMVTVLFTAWFSWFKHQRYQIYRTSTMWLGKLFAILFLIIYFVIFFSQINQVHFQFESIACKQHDFLTIDQTHPE